MLDNMIFDRTDWDVENGTAKGFYRYTDLNRVAAAIRSIRTRLYDDGYVFKFYPVTDFSENTVPKVNIMADYLNAIRVFQGLFAMRGGNYILPVTMDGFDWMDANRIEKFLYDLDLAIDGIEASWCYSDEVFSGEVDV